MKLSRWLTFCGLGIMLLVAAGCSGETSSESAGGSNYPNKSINLIVPFPSGDGTDLVSRAFAKYAEEELGQPVVVNNKPGGGGSIGHAEASKQKADGYNMLTGSSGAMTIKPYAGDVPYSYEDFTPVGQMVEVPIVIAVNESSEFESLNALVKHAKENPGEVTYSTPAAGSSQHVLMEHFASQNDLELKHVPGEGGNGAVSSVMGGHVDVVAVGAPPIAGKDVKKLAVTTEERSEFMPEVPTFKEQDFEIDSSLWFGLFVPSGTPEDIVAQLEESLKKASEDSDVKEEWKNLNLSPAYLNSEDFQKKIENIANENKQIVKEIGLTK
ncbi:tripartite tricarboxylate transporter substrate binding protein [Thalassobacillus sp. CUG 92003]|uniref:Bug family tripartite tricarboxylate transporter substrate binding protein n=1 Tax=Thalassobacillus sp. CUG 92003 TaxID=2736641 RepID=UPI0015E6CEA8|nr:tripartite tricarboxylate transporter substrate binding protein [Thalassobacillus sp. CUG 92003]